MGLFLHLFYHICMKISAKTCSYYLTNCSRGIRNAWHFCYALVLVIKVVAVASVLRCSPLNKALCSGLDLSHKKEKYGCT